MKIKKFKEKNYKKEGIILFTISCLLLVTGVFLYKSFALFETNENKNIIQGNVEDMGDVYFAFYVNDTLQKEMPSKDSGLVLDEEKSYCGVSGQRDEKIKVNLTKDYTIQVSGMTSSRTKCSLYFTTGIFIYEKGIPVVTNGNGLYKVDHNEVFAYTDAYVPGYEYWPGMMHNYPLEVNEEFRQSEYRYKGANPNNYIKFNNELWRIIGLVNVQMPNGEIKQSVKIMRDTPLSEPWWWFDESRLLEGDDSVLTADESAGNVLNYLNNDYYNDISIDYQRMIENVMFQFGSVPDITLDIYDGLSYDQNSVAGIYFMERNKIPITDGVRTAINLNLSVPYLSDYGFALFEEEGQNQCVLDSGIFHWGEASYENCRNNNWFYKKDMVGAEWLLTQSYVQGSGLVLPQCYIFFQNTDASISSISDISTYDENGSMTSPKYFMRPTLFLKENIYITSGNGTSSFPYEISLK